MAKCSICQSPRVADIDRDLSAGVSFARVAKRYAAGVMSVSRHKRHLAVRSALRDAHASSLLAVDASLEDQLESLTRTASGIARSALQQNDVRSASAALRVSYKCAELLATMRQEDAGTEGTNKSSLFQHNTARERLIARLLDRVESNPSTPQEGEEQGIANPGRP